MIFVLLPTKSQIFVVSNYSGRKSKLKSIRVDSHVFLVRTGPVTTILSLRKFLIDESNRDVLHKEKRKFDLVDLVRKLEHGLLGITEIIRISRPILLIFGRLHDKIEG